MSEIYQPYSRSNAGYNPFNSFHYYMHHFKQQPFCFKLSNLCVHDNILEKLEGKGALLLFKSCMDHRNKKKDKREMVATQYFFQWKDAIICLDRTKDSSDDDYPAFSAGASFDEKINNNSFWVHILYTQEETLKELQKLFEYKELTKRGNVFLICQDSIEGTFLKKFDVRLPNEKIDIELNYGKDFETKYQKLVKTLSDDKKSGLVLFSGIPGSGKTTIVKNLAMSIDKKIIFVPPGTVDLITTPAFLNFMMDHRNSILLVEDAEKVIRSRDGEGSNPEGVSNILNLTDGFLGDCLNLFIIATFNTPRERIDKALLRKGRLVCEHHFEEISAEQANIIFKKMGNKRTTDKPLTLAEIYNEEGDTECKQPDRDKKRMGF